MSVSLTRPPLCTMGLNLNDQMWFVNVADPVRIRKIWNKAAKATLGGTYMEAWHEYNARLAEYFRGRQRNPWVQANVPVQLQLTALELAQEWANIDGRRERLINARMHVPHMPLPTAPKRALWGPPGYESDSE